jgi:uncharacterized protein (TIGR00255 family)
MTGFGRGEAASDQARFEVEVRGVNHRFLEIRFRMPEEMSGIEADLRQQIGRVARRGRVDVRVERIAMEEPMVKVAVHRGVIAGYLEAAGKVVEEFSLPGTLTLESVLALPGALRIEHARGSGSDPEKDLLRQALGRALQAFEEARAQEGEELKTDLTRRLGIILSDVDEVTQWSRKSLPETMERIQKRMDSLLESIPIDPTRLAQEAAYLAGRSDVAEEVVRLSAHLRKAVELLETPDGPVGKSLDFLVQELHREVNTIASKSESLEVSQTALRMKAEVERVREQVQNLE